MKRVVSKEIRKFSAANRYWYIHSNGYTVYSVGYFLKIILSSRRVSRIYVGSTFFPSPNAVLGSTTLLTPLVGRHRSHHTLIHRPLFLQRSFFITFFLLLRSPRTASVSVNFLSYFPLSTVRIRPLFNLLSLINLDRPGNYILSRRFWRVRLVIVIRDKIIQ